MNAKQAKKIRRQVRQAIERNRGRAKPLSVWRRVMWIVFGR